MIPLFHDFSDKQVLVLGGGTVALRKARRFSREATVTAVAPEFEPGFDDVDCQRRRERVTAEDLPGLVADAYLVVPATDDEALNAQAANAAAEAGCLVNAVDEAGDVVVPSHVRSTEISLAISTRGASPATTRHLRQQLTPVVEQADGMVAVQRDLRARLKERVDAQAERRRLLRAVIDSDAVWDALSEDTARAKRVAARVVAESGGPVDLSARSEG